MRFYKELLLSFSAASFCAAALFLWQKSVSLIAAGAVGDAVQFIAPTLFLACAAALVSLSSFFVASPQLLLGSTALGVGLPFLFLAPSGTAAFGFFATMALALGAVWRMRRESLLSFSFVLSKAVRNGLPLYFTAVALAVAVFYIEGVRARPEDSLSFLLPKQFVNVLFEQTAGVLSPSVGLPAIRSDTPVDEALSLFVSESLRAQGLPEDRVSPEERARLVEAEREELMRELGVAIREGDTAADVFYLTVVARLRELAGPYARYLPFASGVAFFFAFKAFTFPLYFFSVFLAFALIKLLQFGTLVKVERKMVQVERLTL